MLARTVTNVSDRKTKVVMNIASNNKLIVDKLVEVSSSIALGKIRQKLSGRIDVSRRYIQRGASINSADPPSRPSPFPVIFADWKTRQDRLMDVCDEIGFGLPNLRH
jgi:hypothetical protein